MKGFDKIDVFSGGEEQWQNLEDQDCCVGDEWRIRGDTNYGRSGRNREHWGVIKRSQICGRQPREMCEGRQRDVRRASEIHKFRCFWSWRAYRRWTEWEHGRGYMGTTAEERWDECSDCNASACIRSLWRMSAKCDWQSCDGRRSGRRSGRWWCLSSEKVRRSRIYGECRRCWRFAQRMWRNRCCWGWMRSARTTRTSRWRWYRTRRTRPNSREVRRKQQCRWSSTTSVKVRCTK